MILKADNDTHWAEWREADQRAFCIGFDIAKAFNACPGAPDLASIWQEYGDEFYRMLGHEALAAVDYSRSAADSSL